MYTLLPSLDELFHLQRRLIQQLSLFWLKAKVTVKMKTKYKYSTLEHTLGYFRHQLYLCVFFLGGHVNPAMTFVFALMGRFPWWKVPCYIFAQFLGGFVSAGAVYSVYYGEMSLFRGNILVTLGNLLF